MLPFNYETTYRLDIQGLRAVAIGLVVLAHAGVPGFAGGFVGVDVFFVLSGYLITGLLVQERMSSGRILYGRFLARRLKRLLPALLAMLVVTLIVASLLLSAYEVRMQTGSFWFSATWTSNFFFAFVERDYFSALQADDLFLHTWSLGIEEQFYLVWPWLIAAAFALSKGRALADTARRILPVMISVVFVASLALCLYWSETSQLFSFYLMPARGWQFAIGAAVFLWAGRGNAISGAVNSAIGVIGIILVVGSAVILRPDQVYPGFLAVFPSMGAALLIAAGAGGRYVAVNRVLSSAAFVWLGDRSYSLYLWHWPILLLGSSYGLTGSAAGIAALSGVSIAMAALSYRFVELPLWKGRYSGAVPVRSILVSVLAMLAVIAFSEGLKRNYYGLDAPVAAVSNYDPRVDASPAVYTAGLGCDTGHFSSQLVGCHIGSRNGTSLAVLFGDSIGAQWSSLVTGLFPAPDWQVLVLTKSACAIVDEPYYYDKAGGEYTVCSEWRNAALKYLENIKPDIVFVGSASGYDFSELQWTNGSRRVLSRLASAAEQVVVIPGNPSLSFDGPSCLDEPYKFSYRLADSERECEEAQLSSTSDQVAGFLRNAVRDFPNAEVLDLNDLVCPGRRCAARTEDGLTVFRDNQHLTMTFVDAQIPEASRRLQASDIRIAAD